MNKIHANENKGFSLVELIVVIAIMAVMTAVLAPSLLQYVERSRAQKDDSAMGEVTNVIKLAMADQDVFDEVLTYTIEDNDSHYTLASKDEDKDGIVETAEERYDLTGEDMRGVTITFSPASKGSKSTKYILANGAINAGVESVAGFNGDYSATNLCLGTMNAEGAAGVENTFTGKLYEKVLAGIGADVTLSSQTYRNSNFTVFIDMGSAAGAAVKVYGEWDGKDLHKVDPTV